MRTGRNAAIAIIISVLILTIGVVAIFQISKSHAENTEIIEECFGHFDEAGKVTVKKDSFLSPAVCVKEE